MFTSLCKMAVAAMAAGLIALVAAVPAQRAEAATFTVDSTADAGDEAPGDGVCLTSDGECTLRAAIQEANALAGTDSIDLPAGGYTLTIAGANEDAAARGDLDITDDLLITGAGRVSTIIDGGALDRVMEILSPAVVSISSLTIQNGDVLGLGGGISNRGTLTLIDTTVAGNRASRFGGGIVNYGDLAIGGSNVTFNVAGADSGGISNTFEGAVEIIDSRINNNTAAVAAGGLGNDGVITAISTVVSGNSANAAGGIGNNGTMTIIDSTITGNAATTDSGGIGSRIGAVIEIRSSTVSNNTAETFGGIGNGGTMTIVDSTVRFNSASVIGGGISNGGPMTIIGSTISNNSAGVAGGIVNGPQGTMTVTNSTISGNIAVNSGGALNIGAMTLINSTVSGNSGEEGGGLNNAATLTMKSTIVANNNVGNCTGNGEFISEGDNLEDANTCGFTAASDLPNVDPQLGPLADNGGPTETHALLPGSPAIDAVIDGCPPPDTDQRGVTRPQGVACDIGAFELEGGGPKRVGDVNDDRRVTSVDAALVLQFGAGLIDSLANLDSADVNGDGSVNSIDAALILQFTAGLLDGLPAQS